MAGDSLYKGPRKWKSFPYHDVVSVIHFTLSHDGKAVSFNPGLQYPHLHGPVHTPDNNRWDIPPV